MSKTGARRSRIVLTTFGSLGDLHPYVAIARELNRRGHTAVIATSGTYREKIEALGIEFRPVRPDMPDPEALPGVMRRILDRRHGSDSVIRGFVMPALRDTYADTLAAAERADLLVSHMLTFATQLAAEKRGIPWASTMLQPLGFFSTFDPPVLPVAPHLWRPRGLGPTYFRFMFSLVRKRIRSWADPWRRLRAEIGLPPTTRDPIFDGQHSPLLVLALFSRHYAGPQPDWPPQTVVTGFPFFDEDEKPMPPELVSFLEAGPPPIVFTLGSSAVMEAGTFYEESAEAARLLGRRAVLLAGRDAASRRHSLPDGVIALDYAPYSRLFPRAAAIVHSGGIGTSGHALRSGRPMLVMPYAHDQPDNAARLMRLGVARSIPRGRYSARRAARMLGGLLLHPDYERKAEEIGQKIQAENGAAAACDALESILDSG